VRLWFDEDLSPTLVQVAHDLGFEATCNRDRGALGAKDPELRSLVQRESFVFVTDNASDFRPMYARDEVHPGLIAMPADCGRERQRQLAGAVIRWIGQEAASSGETHADFMVNRLVEIDADGRCSSRELPAA
jgi:predicted nuclease of predicted toxin-antitoxin system